MSAPSLPVTALAPISCAALFWRAGGAARLTLVAKATFAVVPGEAARPLPPVPLVPEDRYRGPVLDEPSDMAPHLPSAGVYVRRRAAAPAAALSLGIHRYQWTLQKRVAGDGPGLASFGPIAPTWSPRRELAPRGEGWNAPIPDLPRDVDFRYFHAAPPDQQCAYLEGDEWLMLEGIHPSLPSVRTRLPSIHAAARLWLSAAAGPVSVPLVADTLAIDGEAFSLVWRGHVEIAGLDLPHGAAAMMGLAYPDHPVAFPDRPPRAENPLAGNVAVSRRRQNPFAGTLPVSAGEVDRSRESAAAPFRVDAPKVAIDPAAPIPGAPFQQPRRRPQNPFAATIEQKDPPEARPLAPFPVAAPRTEATPHLPIPGAPFQKIAIAPEPPPIVMAPVVEAPAVAIEEPAEIVEEAVEIIEEPAEIINEPAAVAEAPAEPRFREVVVARVRAGASLQDIPFSGLDLSGLDLSRADLAGLDLGGAILHDVDLTGANLADADLTGADLTGANLGGADLSRAVLTRARLQGANLANAMLVSAQGSEARFDGAVMESADLRDVRLRACSFDGARLANAGAPRADLTGSRFVRADLGGAVFRRAQMAGAVLAHALVAGADFRDAGLEGANLHGVDRQGARFGGANLKGVVETPPDA